MYLTDMRFDIGRRREEQRETHTVAKFSLSLSVISNFGVWRAGDENGGTFEECIHF